MDEPESPEDVAWQAVREYWEAAGVGDGEGMQAALRKLEEAEPAVLERMRARLWA